MTRITDWAGWVISFPASEDPQPSPLPPPAGPIFQQSTGESHVCKPASGLQLTPRCESKIYGGGGSGDCLPAYKPVIIKQQAVFFTQEWDGQAVGLLSDQNEVWLLSEAKLKSTAGLIMSMVRPSILCISWVELADGAVHYVELSWGENP